MIVYDLIDKNEQELLDVHKKCINNISKLLKETNLNLHQEFYLFCYLLWNGYFSVNKTFSYDSKNIIDENNQVFLGYACCRHNAKLLTEVFKNNQRYTFNIAVQLKKYVSSEFEINRVIKASNNEKAIKNQVNHLVTIVKDNSSVFLLDPTNPSECEIIKSAKIIPLTGKYDVNKKLLDRELDFYLYNYYPLKRKASTTSHEIILDYKLVKEFIYKNKNLFNDFYNDNFKNYETIKKLVLKN